MQLINKLLEVVKENQIDYARNKKDNFYCQYGSDIFVIANQETRNVIASYCDGSGFRFEHFVSTFVNKLTGELYYCVCFGNDTI